MNTPIAELDSLAVRKAFSYFPTGLAALAADIDGERHVLLVASFTVGISLTPPLVSFAVQKTSSTWPLLKDAGAIGVSILSAAQEAACRQLGGKDKAQRWKEVDTRTSASGAIFLNGAVLCLECSVQAEYPAGDHDIVLLQIERHHGCSDHEPLIFHKSTYRTLEAGR